MALVDLQDLSFGKLAEDVIVIAVMGMTGSGKSTFIQRLTESPDIIIGDGLASCTQKPHLYELAHKGVRVILIDTPGFDDTFRTDAAILQEVADCLTLTWNNNLRLSGIIYLHRISDPRMTHGGMRNLAMFRKLCGADPMKNVVLGTTFWANTDPRLAELREKELRTNEDYWAEMIEEGAQMHRYSNTKSSAIEMMETLMGLSRVDLQIQQEMCVDHKTLAETQAGVVLNEELVKQAQKHAEEIADLHKQIAEVKAHDTKLHSQLKRSLTKTEKKLDDMRVQQEILRDARRNEIRELEQEFDRKLRRMTEEKEADSLKPKANKPQQASTENETVSEFQKKQEKREKTVRYVRIGAAIVTAGASIAGCIINPGAAGHAVSSFVSTANSFFDGDFSAGQ